MILTILLVALGQTYWLVRLYGEEFNSLKKGVDAQFRNSFYQLQRTRFLKDSLLFGEMYDTVYVEKEETRKSTPSKPRMSMVLNLKGQYLSDSLTRKAINKINPNDIKSITVVKSADSLTFPPELMEMLILKSQKMSSETELDTNSHKDPQKNIVKGTPIQGDSLLANEKILVALPLTSRSSTAKSNLPNRRKVPVIRMISNNKTLNDSISAVEIQKYFQQSLTPVQQKLRYVVVRKKMSPNYQPITNVGKDTLNGFVTSAQLSGIKTPFSYQLLFPDIRNYLYQEMRFQLAGSVLMILLLVITFLFMYYTLRRQKRLGDIKNEFISNITHELKTPISTVHVALEALKDFNAMEDPQKSKEYLSISMAELNRLELLVDNVLQRSLLEKGAAKMEFSHFNLHKLIQEVLQTMRVRFDKLDVTLTVYTEGTECMINGDEVHMTSVIYNLLDNAIKYSDAAPEVTIKLQRLNDHILLTVADKGIGIPSAYRNKVFQPFFRVPHQDRHNVKGYGLGLSYVAQIIKLHQGSIRVTEGVQKGTVLTIQLPVA